MVEKKQDYYQDVGNYYNAHKEDLNLLLSKEDKIVHHHSGICPPGATFPAMPEDELLLTLHQQETALTLRGIEYLAQPTPESKILDAGCGRGGSSFVINGLYGSQMEGVSLSSYQVGFANKTAEALNLSDKVHFHQANMLELPFAHDYFDFIWACESTEHVPDLDVMLIEFARVAKNDAKLVIIAGCSNPDNEHSAEFIEGINKWYHMLIHPTGNYLSAAERAKWKLTANVNLTSETIPYWHLREKSVHKTGVEKFVEGYESGAGEYRLFGFELIKN